MPCEDGQHERMFREEEQGEYKYVDKIMWKNEAKDKLIRISLCKKCRLVYWDDEVETLKTVYRKPDPNNPEHGWMFGKPDRPELKTGKFDKVTQGLLKKRKLG
jgi:hypothetical protein